MARFSTEQLQQMAQHVVAADRTGDPRAIELYLRVAMFTGLAVQEVRNRILAMV